MQQKSLVLKYKLNAAYFYSWSISFARKRPISSISIQLDIWTLFDKNSQPFWLGSFSSALRRVSRIFILVISLFNLASLNYFPCLATYIQTYFACIHTHSIVRRDARNRLIMDLYQPCRSVSMFYQRDFGKSVCC